MKLASIVRGSDEDFSNIFGAGALMKPGLS